MFILESSEGRATINHTVRWLKAEQIMVHGEPTVRHTAASTYKRVEQIRTMLFQYV